SSRPRLLVLGMPPTANKQCDPSTYPPPVSVTRTPSLIRVTVSARVREITLTPFCENASSSTCAASGSSHGSSVVREDTSVTFEPSSWYAEANSAPVTPEPTTIICSGSSFMEYSCFQLKIRSPSGCAVSSSRGEAPVAINTASEVTVSTSPCIVVTSTTLRSTNLASPIRIRTPLACSP